MRKQSLKKYDVERIHHKDGMAYLKASSTFGAIPTGTFIIKEACTGESYQASIIGKDWQGRYMTLEDLDNER